MSNIQDKAVPLKLKHLARDHERFLWALSIVQSRSVNMKMRMGAFIQDANILMPVFLFLFCHVSLFTAFQYVVGTKINNKALVYEPER
jgi:hypothetical protein